MMTLKEDIEGRVKKSERELAECDAKIRELQEKRANIQMQLAALEWLNASVEQRALQVKTLKQVVFILDTLQSLRTSYEDENEREKIDAMIKSLKEHWVTLPSILGRPPRLG